MIFSKEIVFAVFLLVCFHNGLAQNDTTQKIVPGRINDPAQRKKTYVILISVDGLRSDYAKKYNAVNLLRLSQQGTSAEYMISVYPSLTFPNHYSLVTGLYPAHHGLVDNSFYDLRKNEVYNLHDRKKVEDGDWYRGKPLWVLAEQQKMLTASFYWVGSEAAIEGVRPTYYYRYSDDIPVSQRLSVVKDWLLLPENKRPHFITIYIPEVDQVGHAHGPDSPETEKAVNLVDETIGKLAAITDGLHLPVNFIVVSDHGMANGDTAHPLSIPAVLRDTSLCKVTTGPTLLRVYLKDKTNTPALYRQLRKDSADFDAYLPDETPLPWHHRKVDDYFNRMGDIIIASRFPKFFKAGNGPVSPGKHGFDPAIPEMRATFMAWGPQIRKSGPLPPFENINVFPLLVQLLGLHYPGPVDGSFNALRPILK